ncbi:MAG TPA: histidine kinase [Bacteroidales bacterium]|nr:histidine kinase [Bacteroidales bacterium]
MKNPFLANRTYTITYSVAWILIAGIHAVVLWLASSQDLTIALTDSLLFNVLFAGIGLGLWYSIRYYDFRNSSPLDSFLNHILIALVVLGVWLGIGYLIMNNLWPENQEYHDFLDISIPWRAIAGFFLYSLIVLVYYLYINFEDRKTRIRKESTLQVQVREAEIDMLKAQINPHFLFNSLNSVSSLITSHPEQAREMIVKLSGFLRYSLESRHNGLTSLETELENIRHYLQIEKVRFGDRLLFDIRVPEPCLRLTVPHMILQPLIENSVKHGVYESTEPVRIDLAARQLEDGNLQITVANDFDPDAPPRKGKGIGLINTKNRLYLAYNCENCLTFEKTENRFMVHLTIPQQPLHEQNS